MQDDARRKAIARALAVGIMLVGLLVLLVVSGGGSEPSDPCGGEIPSAAHIEPLSGNTNCVTPDARVGTKPPSPERTGLQATAKAAHCKLQTNLPDEGHTHIGPPAAAEADPPDYKTNPPTSGNHVDPGYQQADGAYSSFPHPVLTVHSLEHGRVEIQYAPNLSESRQLELKGLFDESTAGMLLFPNPKMPYAVAATAWRQLLGCEKWRGSTTIDAIRAFRTQFRGQGPEQVPFNY